MVLLSILPTSDKKTRKFAISWLACLQLNQSFKCRQWKAFHPQWKNEWEQFNVVDIEHNNLKYTILNKHK